ncbi:coenzyme F420-0:L-glutamate ligase [Acuticoccus mangrovi]|uniref:Coenzyme F420-0:L-glutamate ligase n=1 Tax=Acuticoccus mangrovi TaxID=2796142 RepID=A0A934MH62_9HYPH|nr:coenzyme F420-0:L-glutamate ligase [Acuticoccus mangrovi]MBJ3776620.1 coenzyme F420-0:L-glutamate ligase [Acuticoccus mangrovi]
MTSVSLIGLNTLPTITSGTDLVAEILDAADREAVAFQDGDILVVAQKIVSKAEGRLLPLSALAPSADAARLAEVTQKDARLVEAILSESVGTLRTRPGLMVVEHRLGHIMANAGIDRSNIGGDADMILLLPEDPDASAAALREGIAAATGSEIGVIVSDSFGRPWRMGTTGVAIGVAGPAMLLDRRGEADRDGRRLEVTEVAFADSVAAAGVLVMGEGAEGRPAVVVRGLDWTPTHQGARDGLRPAGQDLFR